MRTHFDQDEVTKGVKMFKPPLCGISEIEGHKDHSTVSAYGDLPGLNSLAVSTCGILNS